MSSILVKIFATALTLSQVTVAPEAVKTSFDPVRDRAAVTQLLKDGCSHMRRAFDIEDINLDELISTAMEDPQAVAGDMKVLQGISFTDLHKTYQVYCKGEAAEPPVDLGEVITYYNGAVADLPTTGSSRAQAPGREHDPGRGRAPLRRAARARPPPDLGAPQGHPRGSPEGVRGGRGQALLPAQGHRRARRHPRLHGQPHPAGRPQGGSTITQQLVKNLLVGDDVTYERKMREMIVATRIEARSRSPRSWRSTSTRSISAAPPGASRWRPRAISANPPRR
jgi:hypothetical protein